MDIIEQTATLDNVVFEDDVPEADRLTIEELLADAEYQFTPQSYQKASAQLGSILADYRLEEENYPPPLITLLEYTHVYSIYDQQRSVKIWSAILAWIGGVLGCFIAWKSFGWYAEGGMIVRAVNILLSLTVIAGSAFGFGMALLNTVNYILCNNARRLFATAAKYTGQGNCKYLGKDEDGKRKFSASVIQPIVFQYDEFAFDDLLDSETMDLIQDENYAGAIVRVIAIAIFIGMYWYLFAQFEIGLFNYLWFFW
ncbi:MAG: hypothetical protein RSF73_08425 [Ruthenibacterium sp.]